MSPRKLGRQVVVSLVAAGPAGGFLFGLLHAGDPDPNPIGRLVHACLMAGWTPWHGGFPPSPAAGAGQSANAWPHIAVAFALILAGGVLREWRRAGKSRGTDA